MQVERVRRVERHQSSAQSSGPWFQFSLARLGLATALVAVPFALMRIRTDTAVFVAVAGFLWGLAVGVLVGNTWRAALGFGVVGVIAFSAWALVALAISPP